jgi:hypothetical protein
VSHAEADSIIEHIHELLVNGLLNALERTRIA